MKKLRLVFENIPPRSKQHAHGRVGSRTFVTASYRDWKEKVAWIAKIQAQDQGWEYTETNALCFDWHFKYTFPVADIDNIKGGFLDALEGFVMLDDCQIDREGETKLEIADKKQITITITNRGKSPWVTHALNNRQGKRTRYGKKGRRRG